MPSYVARLAFTFALFVCSSLALSTPARAAAYLFEQCDQPCPILSETPTALAMIQTAISTYNVQVSQGLKPALTVGAGVQIEAVTHTPAGYVKVDHFFVISALPGTSWAELTDGGVLHDSETYFVDPPPPGSERGLDEYLGGFTSFDLFYIELPWPGYPGA